MDATYNVIPQRHVDNKTKISNDCMRRNDDSGLLSWLKAWSLFFLHLVASLVLFVCITRWVDGFDFQTRSPTSIFQIETRLYQTQVNGLLSLALVLVRLLASHCTALVVRRMI